MTSKRKAWRKTHIRSPPEAWRWKVLEVREAGMWKAAPVFARHKATIAQANTLANSMLASNFDGRSRSRPRVLRRDRAPLYS